MNALFLSISRHTRRTIFCLVTVCVSIVFAACSNEDNPSPDNSDGKEYTGIPLIILDTDIGSSTDDLFAMRMLYRYADENQCVLLGVVVDRQGEDCAALADVMNTYFGYPDLPIGVERHGILSSKVWIDYRPLPTLTSGDKLMFKTSVSDYSALPDGWQLYRRLLSEQPDHSVSVCSIGFMSSLAQLLTSGGDSFSPLSGVELVRQKVKHLYLMGGVFDNDEEPEYNFAQGIEFAATFFRLWPADVPVTFSPTQVGDLVEYVPEQVISDISWTDIHPIKQVYMNYNCNTGQKMWDPMAVINAVEGDGLFKFSPWGIVTFHPDATTTFAANPTGRHRYQVPGIQKWSEDMLQKIRDYTMIR